MKILAFDSSSRTGSIALLRGENREKNTGLELLGEWTLSIDNSFHSEKLLWGVHHLLESARSTIEEIDLFGVGVGPGSFTGLRIGVTTARTLAHTLKKPLIGVSSLAALARPAAVWLKDQKEKPLIVAVTDAAKGELFALWGFAAPVADCVAAAEGDFAGLWARGVREEVITAEALTAELRKRLKGKSGAPRWMAIGEGRYRYPEMWATLPKKLRLDPPYPFSDGIQGRYIGLLAWEGYQSGLQRDALSVHPRYLRASDAEVKLKAGLLSPAPVKSGHS
jgi:tRNA threonylcarbamoyl adenosine modification protein YeaZ